MFRLAIVGKRLYADSLAAAPAEAEMAAFDQGCDEVSNQAEDPTIYQLVTRVTNANLCT